MTTVIGFRATRRQATLALGALLLSASGLVGDRMAAAEEEIEEPPFTLLDRVESIEIREYGPRLAAEADMAPGSGVQGGQYSAFMLLADFIFAKSRAGEQVAMTAPVAIERAAEPIAMTAPVAMEPGGAGGVMRFFMPAEYTIETLPKPGDDRVRIVTVPAQTLAVLRFAGEANDAEVAARKAELLAGLQESGWRPVGEPGLFGYDPPGTPPAERRNEVYVEVESVNE
jgi:hypothetical protein